MILRCVTAFTGAILLALTGVAVAQVPTMTGPLPSFETAPPAPPPGTGMVPPGARPPQAGAPSQAAMPPGGPPGGQEPPCFKEFLALRQEAQKKASLITTVKDRNPPPTREEMCQTVKTFAAAEAKVIKYVVDNQASCGIPPEAITQMKAGQAQTVKFRTAVCTGGPAAAGKAPAPAVPKLSDELGIRGIAGPTEGGTGRGTFDTLTGNALER